MKDIPVLIVRDIDPSLVVGYALQSVRSSRSRVAIRFDSGYEFSRELVGGEFKATSKDWWLSLKGLKCIAVSEYQEGMVFDFGLHGLFIENSGGIRVLERRPPDTVQ